MREERPSGCSRHHAVVLHCSMRSGPEESSVRQEPSARNSKAAEGLPFAGLLWLWQSIFQLRGQISPASGHSGCGTVSVLRWQDKRNYRDLSETPMSKDRRGKKLH